jgi:nucleoside-diphosphate-sugar epimerase
MTVPVTNNTPKKQGILIGGSGLIGGAITHHFKTKAKGIVDLRAPNSKKVSLRVPDDIQGYITSLKPDFIINAAIASIDSDPQLSYETNYLGTVHLARLAADLKIPYIHISSTAVMPDGKNLAEEDMLPLSARLPNYVKSKLMAELTLRDLRQNHGLDYTAIRLAVVYGKHDHKIQGFHRMLFSIVDQGMPCMLTRRGVLHSYSNSKKLPSFVHHVLNNRQEFGGQTINFADHLPVELAQLILTIRSYLELGFPKEIYAPYPLAKPGQVVVKKVLRALRHIGIEARLPAELLFLENFYKSQTLSVAKLAASSWQDPEPGVTVFTYLPSIIQYYVTRWEHLNLIEPFDKEFFDPKKRAEEFLRSPESLLEAIHLENRERLEGADEPEVGPP